MANNPTEAEIDAMKPGEVYRLLSDFGVDGDALSLKDAKASLRQRVQELKEGAKTATEQAAEMMADIATSYKTRRELLLERRMDVMKYLPTLDQDDREKLALRFGCDVMGILEDVQHQLSKDDCPILVAGETSSGKSTFLNLLLGEDILPVAHLSSTSTICELKYGENRRAVVHLREPDVVTGSTEISIQLSTNPEECRQQLGPYIHLEETERDTLPPASKIEIFWPLAILKGGATIVDSPGVGESEMMDEIIAKYIPSTFAFIYIIDSYRAGGVQQDRLGRLLMKCKDLGARAELEQFDPRKAIFVLNKWQMVPVDERDKVKEDTFRKLQEMWPGLKESQVFIHSNKKVGKGGFWSADFSKLLDGIYDLLQQTINHKLSVQYRRIVNILEEALTYVKLKLNDVFRNLDKGERHKAYMEARSELARFFKYTDHIIKELTDFLDDAKKITLSIIENFTQGDELKRRLSKVSIRACTDDYAKKKMFVEASSYFLVKHKPLKDHIKTVKEQFRAQLQAMPTGVDHECTKYTYVRHVTKERFHVFQNWKWYFFFSRWMPGDPVEVLLVRLIIAYMKLRPSLYMPESSTSDDKHSTRPQLYEMAIAEMTKDKAKLLEFIEEPLLMAEFTMLKHFTSDLQAIKKVEKRLVEERFAETRGQLELASKYKPQSLFITRQLGRLGMLNLTALREFEFDLDSIVGWGHAENRIGGGSYGEVYWVHVERDGVSVPAALKLGILPYDLTTEKNAWEFLTEEDNLRKLKGEHIVEYYGTACRREGGGLRLGLVMELCVGTLEDRVIGHKEHNPTWWGHDLDMKQRAFSYIQDKAIQLCEGLRTIQDAGYIHRDLKMGNILVTAGDVVKLADVGVTKREVNVTGTVIGTAVYAAPEVKARQLYDKSADIYSLGLILWEMWYGRAIWQAMEDPSLRGLTEGGSMMMPDSPDSVRPIPDWAALVRDCEEKDATKRPTALNCLRRIRDMRV